MRRIIRGPVAALVAIAAVLGGVFGAAIVAYRQPATPPLATPATAGPQADALEVALANPIPEVWIEDRPLTDAAAIVAKAAGVPVRLDLKALQQDERSPDERVTLRTRNASLIETLDTLTALANAEENNASSGLPRRPIAWCASGGGIVIGTQRTVDTLASFVTRVYDIQHLMPRTTTPAGPATCFDADFQTDLAKLVTDTIRPETWRDSGGQGVLRIFGSRLIVSQSIVGHVQLRDLLDQLSAPDRPAATTQAAASPPLEVFTFHPVFRRWVSQSTDRADAALRTRQGSFELADVPLGQAMDLLAFSVGMDLLPEAASSLPLDRKVSIKMRNACAWEILRAMLAQVSDAADRDQEWTWWLDGGVVIVGAAEHAEPTFRLYDLDPFVRQAQGSASKDQTAPGSFGGSPTADTQRVIDSLTDLLMNQVDPPSWRDRGGKLGFTRYVSGRLAIVQTWENQERIAALLAAMKPAEERAEPPGK